MIEILQKLRNFGLIPIVTLDNPEDVRPLARALAAAYLDVLEVTFRTPAAGEAIRILKAEFPGMLAGAGTILTIELARKAIDAGARFILTPGFNPKIVDYCLEQGITIIPGVNAPTQVEFALEKGIKVLKFFPAEQSGGIELIKAIGAPFPGIQFVPTGGITNGNLASYFAWERICACGGSWIAGSSLLASHQYDRITEQVQQAIKIMLGFSLSSIELPHISGQEIEAVEPLFSRLFHGSGSTTGNELKVTETFSLKQSIDQSDKNILCFTTPDLGRAVHYLEKAGSVLNQYQAENNSREIILRQQINGFGIKIIKRR